MLVACVTVCVNFCASIHPSVCKTAYVECAVSVSRAQSLVLDNLVLPRTTVVLRSTNYLFFTGPSTFYLRQRATQSGTGRPKGSSPLERGTSSSARAVAPSSHSGRVPALASALDRSGMSQRGLGDRRTHRRARALPHRHLVTPWRSNMEPPPTAKHGAR